MTGEKVSTVTALKGFGEVIVVFAAFLLWIKYLETTWVGTFQDRLVGWDFFAHIMMVLFPTVALVITGRPLADLGLTRENWRNPEVRKITRVAVAELALIWVVCLLIPHMAIGQRPHLLLPSNYFAENLGLPVRVTKYIGWGLTVVFTTIFCGLGEEIFFRGYMQGRVNRTIGRPFRVMGIQFGWGLIFASIIFGFGHLIAFFNPFVPDHLMFHPNWGEFAVTCVEGFVFGMLYEHTGGIVAPAILHGFIGLFFGAMIFPG